MKSFLHLTILMAAIVTIEGQFWTNDRWKHWEWITFGTGWDNDWDVNLSNDWWRSEEAKEANGQRFQLCDKDGEIGLTLDELKNCEVSFSLC